MTATSLRHIFLWLVVLALFLALPFLHWHYLLPVRNLQIAILDKTVPDRSYREHKGLMWIINNLKYGPPLAYERDYFGFFPIKEKQTYNIKELPEVLNSYDLIYLADTYGVYTEDFYRGNPEGKHSRLIYGGLTPTEMNAIKAALQQSSVLVAEFNAFASPTGAAARQALEETLGLSWTGWIGRYFADLSAENTEIPRWLIVNYEKQSQTKWKFKGPGIALVRADGTEVILRQGQELGPGLNKIYFPKQISQSWGVKTAVPYYYWFDLVVPSAGTRVLGYFELDLTTAGKQLLDRFNLPSRFPAVTVNQPQNAYYLAGDFDDCDEVPPYYQASTYKFFKQLLTVDYPGDPKNFFWQVYYPLVEHITGFTWQKKQGSGDEQK